MVVRVGEVEQEVGIGRVVSPEVEIGVDVFVVEVGGNRHDISDKILKNVDVFEMILVSESVGEELDSDGVDGLKRLVVEIADNRVVVAGSNDDVELLPIHP